MRRTAAAGYDLIEVPVLDPADVDPAMTRELAAEHGLTTRFSTGLTPDTDVSSDDPDTVAAGARLLADAVDVVAAAGSDFLGGVVSSAMAKYTTLPTPRGRANAIAVLRDVADRAAADGITIGLEVVNRYESNLLNTADQALAFLDELDRDNVGVHLDVYHMNIEERDLAGPVRRCADAGRLVHVHVGESHRGYLGTGSVDLLGLFRALADVGYVGPLVFESFSSVVVSEAFTTALGIWREPWRDADDLARHARQTIATHTHAARQLAADTEVHA
ncbi:sugar phosphate isomerase/epimerase [Nitriliruptoraceae bacterium ZYF776]|nr:sugar phosphate isomerase/epimerase [Profundirhabdus halotolerans]